MLDLGKNVVNFCYYVPSIKDLIFLITISKLKDYADVSEYELFISKVDFSK